MSAFFATADDWTIQDMLGQDVEGELEVLEAEAVEEGVFTDGSVDFGLGNCSRTFYHRQRCRVVELKKKAIDVHVMW